MRLSDGLKQKRGDLLDRMTVLSDAAAAEGRLLTDGEPHDFDAAKSK